MCMSFVAIDRSLTIVSYVAFKMAALWFWTMFNCNPLIAHCHPLLWGGGILVDHWSTISSFQLIICCVHHFIFVKLPTSKCITPDGKHETLTREWPIITFEFKWTLCMIIVHVFYRFLLPGVFKTYLWLTTFTRMNNWRGTKGQSCGII